MKVFHLFHIHFLKPFKHYCKHHIRKPFKSYFKNHIKKPIKLYIQNHFFRKHTMLDTEVKMKARWNPEYTRKRTENCEKVFQDVRNIESKRDRTKKISVVFICQFNAAWNSCMSTFQAALRDPDINVTLLALPDKIMRKGTQERVSDIKAEIYGDNVAFAYCKSFFPGTINAYNEADDSWFDLEALNPDYVIISRSNQNYLPPQYRCEVLSTYTKVCHIPYAYCKMIWDSRAVYRANLSDYVYATFTENETYCKMLKIIYHETFHAAWKKIKYFGFPRFDLYSEEPQSVRKTKKTVLWLPRWVTESRLEPTTFFKYKDALIEFFKGHSDINLICRPHPKMFGNFIATGEMSETEVDKFQNIFAETENFTLDEYSDYLPSFHEADIFISDTSSLLVEEFITGKPIIFCGNMRHFDRDAKKWAEHMYPVHNKGELLKQLTKLLQDNDPKKPLRADYIKENMKHDGKCGDRIVAFFKEDFYNDCSADENQLAI